MEPNDLRPRKCAECDFGLAHELERSLLITLSCNCADPDCKLREVTLCPAHAIEHVVLRMETQQQVKYAKEQGASVWERLLEQYEQFEEQRKDRKLPDLAGFPMLPEIDL